MSRSAVRLTKGEPALFAKIAESGNTATRSFCAACGTPLFASSSGGAERIGVKASSLDDPSWYEPEANVWLESAQPWHRPDRQVPGFARNRASALPSGRDA
jgi:hypothetical protein